MKRMLGCLILTVCSLSCTDLDLMRSEIDALSEKVLKLEQSCERINNDIAALSKTVQALQMADMVTSVSPLTSSDGTVEGYILNFVNSGIVTIYNGRPGEKGDTGDPGKDGEDGKDGQNGQDGAAGKDGTDASAPVISVREDGGRYYWTSDGEWVLDSDGNRVEVDRGAVAPKMKLEGSSWYVSYDGGKTWNYLADFVPETEGYIFKDVDDSSPDHVKIALSDGTVLEIPKYKEPAISLTCDTVVSAGDTFALSYSVSDASSVSVVVDDSDVASATVSASDAVSGSISVTLKSAASLIKQRIFVIFRVNDSSDDWWLVSFDSSGKVLISDIR